MSERKHHQWHQRVDSTDLHQGHEFCHQLLVAPPRLLSTMQSYQRLQRKANGNRNMRPTSYFIKTRVDIFFIDSLKNSDEFNDEI